MTSVYVETTAYIACLEKMHQHQRWLDCAKIISICSIVMHANNIQSTSQLVLNHSPRNLKTIDHNSELIHTCIETMFHMVEVWRYRVDVHKESKEVAMFRTIAHMELISTELRDQCELYPELCDAANSLFERTRKRKLN